MLLYQWLNIFRGGVYGPKKKRKKERKKERKKSQNNDSNN